MKMAVQHTRILLKVCLFAQHWNMWQSPGVREKHANCYLADFIFCAFQLSYINSSGPSLPAYLRAFLATWQVNDQSFTPNAAHRPGQKAGERRSEHNTRPWTSLAAEGKAQSVSRCVYLDSMPSGVTLSDPISIARAIPGASRSITSLVACNANTQVTSKDSTNNYWARCAVCVYSYLRCNIPRCEAGPSSGENQIELQFITPLQQSVLEHTNGRRQAQFFTFSISPL